MSSPSDSIGDLRFHRITSVSIVGGFLDGQRFDLADGLNCIIGARGTGKTTVLEFVRFAMNAMPGDAAARKRIESLVASNLAGGRVEVAVETRDGLSYIVSRSAGDETMVLTTDRSPTDINLRSGGLFRVDIFSQNEVEAIADRASSQLDLIDNFEAERIAAIEHRIRALQADLSGNASKITPLQEKGASSTNCCQAAFLTVSILPEATRWSNRTSINRGKANGQVRMSLNASRVPARRIRLCFSSFLFFCCGFHACMPSRRPIKTTRRPTG